MEKMIKVPEELKAMIARQSGVFTRKQAFASGITKSVLDRFAREERWFSVEHGLWSTSPELDWPAKLWGGVLLGGDAALIGGQAAACLWGAAEEPGLVDIWCPTHRRYTSSGIWQFRRGPRRREGELEPPRISLAQAVLEMSFEASVDDVVGHVSRAIKSKATTTTLIREAVEATRRYPNRQLLVDITHDHDTGSESPLERRFLHDVLRAHGLPEGTRQAAASRRGFTDVGFVEYGVLVELDGRSHHEGLAAHADMARDNGNLLNGNRTFRYGFGPVAGRPCQVAGELGVAFKQGGWTGQRQPCPRCRQRRRD